MIQLRNQGFGVGSTHSMLGSVLLLVSWLMPVIWLNCRETSSRWVPRFAGSVKLPFIEFSRRYLPDEATTQKSHWSIVFPSFVMQVVSWWMSSRCITTLLPFNLHFDYCLFVDLFDKLGCDVRTDIFQSSFHVQTIGESMVHCWTLAIVGTLTGPVGWDSWEDLVEVVLRGCHSQNACKLQFCTETWNQYPTPTC